MNPLLGIALSIYIIDRAIRLVRSRVVNKGDFEILFWSDRVIELRIPVKYLPMHVIMNKKAHSGFVQIKIPEISLIQSHPFDVSFISGKDYFSLYITNVGSWTKKLFEISNRRSLINSSDDTIPTLNSKKNPEIEEFSGISETVLDIYKDENKTSNLFGAENSESKIPKFFKSDFSLILSPIYDTNSRYIFENEVVVLAATGSGISTMISLVEFFISNKTSQNIKTNKLETVSKLIDSDVRDLVYIELYYSGKDESDEYTLKPMKAVSNRLKQDDGIVVFSNLALNYENHIQSIFYDEDIKSYGFLVVGSANFMEYYKFKVEQISQSLGIRRRVNIYLSN
ncbi:Ferric reductase transmembrane component 1 [Smittium culicis]|uniref:Ferric reductase transmembrane component 1 n=1 Tax=Smittium culicis TaxID=133412 RepID=A0A1R1YND9_9FUNG|nr:Ferric reductase transmembrane component 1 [Smittium culicis]